MPLTCEHRTRPIEKGARYFLIDSFMVIIDMAITLSVTLFHEIGSVKIASYSIYFLSRTCVACFVPFLQQSKEGRPYPLSSSVFIQIKTFFKQTQTICLAYYIYHPNRLTSESPGI